MEDCLFCKIINGEVKSSKVYEDENVFAFRDINPQAPVHILVVPKVHISTLNDIEEKNRDIIGYITYISKCIAEKEGLKERGYRIVLNCNREAGQTVFHIHLHLLGGRPMGWPPG